MKTIARTAPLGGRVQHARDRRHVLRSGERERARHAGRGAGTDGDDERGEGEAPAVRGQRDRGVLVDAGERAAVQLGAAAPRDLLERHGTGAAEPERRRDRRGPVEELRSGCQQLEVHMAPGELVQREQGFERGDAAARDQHPWSLARDRPRRGHGQTAAGVGTSTCSASSTSRFA